jgi:hypothetical protein
MVVEKLAWVHSEQLACTLGGAIDYWQLLVSKLHASLPFAVEIEFHFHCLLDVAERLPQSALFQEPKVVARHGVATWLQ